MKKEQFFRLLGELDDRFLEKYRQIDLRLSHKAYRKKRTLRILAVAACLALLIGVCVPVGMMIAQLGKGPSDPLPSITLQSLAELDTLREMIECEDEQVLNDYLHSITGGGAQSRQDLIDFLNLVDNTPYARFIDGTVTSLTYNEADERFTVTVDAENGESVYVSYELGMSNVEKNMNKAARKLGKENLLSVPLTNGHLTLYTETREPRSDGGDVIRWQGILDGIAVYIVYWVADADAVNTATLLASLEVADSITADLENTDGSETTERPIETDTSFDPDRVPELVKMGYLAISVRDTDGTVTPLLSAEELEGFRGGLDVGYVSGRVLIIEGYAGYNRNGSVQYTSFDDHVTAEQVSYSDIETSVSIDVDAKYVHCFRYTVELDQFNDGEHVIYLIGEANATQIEGYALLERFEFNVYPISDGFPRYTWSGMRIGAFVQEPQLINYGVLQENGGYGSMGWGQAQDYQDPDAPVTYIAPYPIANEVAALEYVTSMSQSLDRQAIHVYMARTDTAEYSVYVDAQTRECIGWQVEGEAFGVPYATEQEKLAATYQYLQEHVRDPEAYTPSVTEQDGYIYCRYSRYVGNFDSCDEVTALFDGQGYMVAVIGDYLGALRDMQEVPEALLNAVQVQLEEIRDTNAVMEEITVKNLHISSTGQILLDCSITVRNQQSDESREYKYYAYLTEYVQQN